MSRARKEKRSRSLRLYCRRRSLACGQCLLGAGSARSFPEQPLEIEPNGLAVSHLSFTTPTSEMDLAVSEIWYGQTKHSVPICAWPNKLGNSLFRTFNYQPPSIQQSLYYAHIAKRSQLISTK